MMDAVLRDIAAAGYTKVMLWVFEDMYIEYREESMSPFLFRTIFIIYAMLKIIRNCLNTQMLKSEKNLSQCL